MNIEHISIKRDSLAARINDTKEKVYEFEFWDGIYNLLDELNTFDQGIRKIDFETDIDHLILRLKHTQDLLSGNIKYLKRRE